MSWNIYNSDGRRNGISIICRLFRKRYRFYQSRRNYIGTGMIIGNRALVPEMAWAVGSSLPDAQEVPVNGNWYKYKISEGEYVYCPIVIKDNGRLDVSVQKLFPLLQDQNLRLSCYLMGMQFLSRRNHRINNR